MRCLAMPELSKSEKILSRCGLSGYLLALIASCVAFLLAVRPRRRGRKISASISGRVTDPSGATRCPVRL